MRSGMPGLTSTNVSCWRVMFDGSAGGLRLLLLGNRKRSDETRSACQNHLSPSGRVDSPMVFAGLVGVRDVIVLINGRSGRDGVVGQPSAVALGHRVRLQHQMRLRTDDGAVVRCMASS